jgi:transposase-like protein
MVGAHEARPTAKPKRSFTMEQKRAIVAEADRCSRPGDVGALLRKHGIYSSTLSRWRVLVAAGAPLRSAGRPATHDDRDKELAELRRRVSQLEARATRAERLVDFQKKALSLLDAMTALGEG